MPHIHAGALGYQTKIFQSILSPLAQVSRNSCWSPTPRRAPAAPRPCPPPPDPPAAAGARPTLRETTQVARSKQALRAKNERESEPQSREVRKPRPGLPQPRRVLLQEAAVAIQETGPPYLLGSQDHSSRRPCGQDPLKWQAAPARSIPSARSALAHAHTLTRKPARPPARQGEVVPAPAPRAALSRVQRPHHRSRPAPRPHSSGAALHLTTGTQAKPPPAAPSLPRPVQPPTVTKARAGRGRDGVGPGGTAAGLYLSRVSVRTAGSSRATRAKVGGFPRAWAGRQGIPGGGGAGGGRAPVKPARGPCRPARPPQAPPRGPRTREEARPEGRGGAGR
ncbi:hypothetical protein ACRRTK_018367 [Alexandromys fortis]